jgi:hypothetical protein
MDLNQVLLNINRINSFEQNVFAKTPSQDSAIDNDFEDEINGTEVIPQLEYYLKDSDINFKRRPTLEVLHKATIDHNFEVKSFNE